MKVHNKIGSPERLKEIFQNVNKIKVNESFDKKFKKKLNESFDSPKEKDEKYLNKGGDKKGIDVQPNKYDDGVREPRERNIQVKDKSVEKLKGDDKPITEGIIDVLKKEFNDLVAGWEQMKPQTYSHRQGGTGGLAGAELGQQNQGKMQLAQELLNIIRQHGEGSPQAKQFKIDNPPPSASLTQSYVGESEEEEVDNIPDDVQISNPLENLPNDEEDVDAEVTDIENLDTGEEEVGIGIEDNGEEIGIEMGDNGEEAIEGGLADGASPADFDPRQILLGMEVEMEHTHTPQEALEIAMDHLKEDPAYYGSEGGNPDLEAQENAAEDAAEIEDEVIGTEIEGDEENPENLENDDLSVNMNWLETIKPKSVDDMDVMKEYDDFNPDLNPDDPNMVDGSDDPIYQEVQREFDPHSYDRGTSTQHAYDMYMDYLEGEKINGNNKPMDFILWQVDYADENNDSERWSYE